MKLLKYTKNQVVALVDDGMTREENIRHWDVCKALSEGKTIEIVAEDFHLSTRNVDYIKAKKCKKCGD